MSYLQRNEEVRKSLTFLWKLQYQSLLLWLKYKKETNLQCRCLGILLKKCNGISFIEPGSTLACTIRAEFINLAHNCGANIFFQDDLKKSACCNLSVIKMIMVLFINSIYNPVYCLSAPINTNYNCPKP